MLIMYGIVFAQLRRRLRAVTFQEKAAITMAELGESVVQVLSSIEIRVVDELALEASQS